MKEVKPLISVIVPVYNVERYLNQCVDSIINQTYTNLEIILVDDGSPDRCPQICDEYAYRDKRIKVFHTENGGQSKARNLALKHCRGDYIAFVDSDDWIKEDTFEKVLSEIKKQNVDVAFYTANIIMNGICVEKRFQYFPDKMVVPQNKLIELTLKDEIGGQPWLKVMKRKCWRDVEFPEGRIYEDLAISFRPFIYANNGAVFLDEALYNYRMNLRGTSLEYNPQRNYHIFLAFKDHYEYALKYYKAVEEECLERTASFAMGYCNNRIRYIYNGNVDSLTDTEDWLRRNKRRIMRCSSLSAKRKAMIALYLGVKPLYMILYRGIITLERQKDE